MKREFLMERIPGQTRTATLEDGRLCDLRIDRMGDEALTGNIYLGRVENIIPGLNAAFVDIGADKNAFLHACDLPDEMRTIADRSRRIENTVRRGQELLVQVIKEPGGSKGCRVSTQLTLPGRLCVLLPDLTCRSISNKIAEGPNRKRLTALAEALVQEGGQGVILRTAAADADEDTLRAEYAQLCAQYRTLTMLAATRKAPCLLRDAGSPALKLARDLPCDENTRVVTDGEDLYKEVTDAIRDIAPGREGMVSLYAGETPLFDLYGIDRKFEKSFGRYFWLDSGGSIVIEETEALTVIDVNTGKFTGKRSQEETVFKLNKEAAAEIARLIRLKDIGGIIIIDFIDMRSEENREALLLVLREALSTDRNRTIVHGYTNLGLVEMTRKKLRTPMQKLLEHGCPACSGTGWVPTYDTVARRAVREIWKTHRAAPETRIVLTARYEVITCVQSVLRGYEKLSYQRDDTLPTEKFALETFAK